MNDLINFIVLSPISKAICSEERFLTSLNLILVTSSTPGHACACDPDDLKPGIVIGKALEEKDSLLTGTIEVLINNN